MIISYLNFTGAGLYLASALIFLYLWIRTLRTKDGIGLAFLKVLTFCIFVGSLVVFLIRAFSEYGTLPLLTARAMAIINPILLVGVGLYLNFLFHQKKIK